MRDIEKAGIFPDTVVFVNDTVVLERHFIAMKRHHLGVAGKMRIIQLCLFHGSYVLFIHRRTYKGWLQMIKIITLIIRVERTHGWFLIVYLTQGEAVFIVGK